MNKLLLTAIALASLSQAIDAKRSVVNKIVVRVNGSNILLSDLSLPRIAKEGKPFTLDEAISDELFFQHAATMKMLPTATEVDRQFNSFKINNGLQDLSDDEFEAQLKENGFTLESYKGQLGKLIAVENVKRAEISEKIIISAQEVEEYHKAHPKSTKEAFHLKVATISKEALNAKKEATPEANLQDLFANDSSLDWEDHGFINTEDLHEDYRGAQHLAAGQIMDPIDKDDNFELVMLVARQEARLLTLAEQYDEVERKIQAKRRNKIIADLDKNLRLKATITHIS